jgi:hypothetical protein
MRDLLQGFPTVVISDGFKLSMEYCKSAAEFVFSWPVLILFSSSKTTYKFGTNLPSDFWHQL